MTDDQTLLGRYTRTRDADAFAELAQRYSAMVFSTARRITRNVTMAEDITQEFFFRLARHAASIRGSLPAWLHRVALNRALDMRRKEATRQVHESQTVLPASQPGSDELTWQQIAPLVDAALTQLPHELREPLIQHYLCGRTQTQVAESLHIGQATVSRRIQEGLERVRQQMETSGLLAAVPVPLLASLLAGRATTPLPATLVQSLGKLIVAGPPSSRVGFNTWKLAVLTAPVIVALGGMIVMSHYPGSTQQGQTMSTGSLPARGTLHGDGFTQDSFSLAIQAALGHLHIPADYDTIYALSTNAFAPGLEVTGQECKAWWHVQAWLGDKGLSTLAARYSFTATSLDPSDLAGDEATYRRTIAPLLKKALSQSAIVVEGGWADPEPWPWTGLVTSTDADGTIRGAALNGRVDNELKYPYGLLALVPAKASLTPHEADVLTLRLAIARIRGEGTFASTSRAAFGLAAMDAWMHQMSSTPGFCAVCWAKQARLRDGGCARDNALTMTKASETAGRYLREIAASFPPQAGVGLLSAAARYDRIVALLHPALTGQGGESYGQFLGDMKKQRDYAQSVLLPIKTDLAAIAADLQQACALANPTISEHPRSFSLQAVPYGQEGNTYIRGLHSILRYAKIPVTYDRLMGLSGTAFIIQSEPTHIWDGKVDIGWWPLDSGALLCRIDFLSQAIGRQIRLVPEVEESFRADPAAFYTEHFHPEVQASIEQGLPILARHIMGFVITGYDGTEPVGHYGCSTKSGHIEGGPAYPWGLLVLGQSLPRLDTASADRESLRYAIALAHDQAPTELPDQYTGQKSYRAWSSYLRQHDAATEDRHHYNVLLYLRLHRTSAVAFLREMASRRSGDLAHHLNAAADRYQELLSLLPEAPVTNVQRSAAARDQLANFVDRLACLDTRAVTEMEQAVKSFVPKP